MEHVFHTDSHHMVLFLLLFSFPEADSGTVSATAFLFASPPVTVLAGPWLFFAVLSSLNSCIWFYDQIFISLHSVLPLFS